MKDTRYVQQGINELFGAIPRPERRSFKIGHWGLSLLLGRALGPKYAIVPLTMQGERVLGIVKARV